MNYRAYSSSLLSSENEDVLTNALGEMVYFPNDSVYFNKLARHTNDVLKTVDRVLEVPFDTDALTSIKQLQVPEVTEQSVSLYLAKVLRVLRLTSSYDKKKVTGYLQHILPVEKYNKVATSAMIGTPSQTPVSYTHLTLPTIPLV